MAQQALTGRTQTRGRAFFGLLDANGWGWASLKATFWFIVMIFVLGYIPDRAYYFTVNRTMDLGILAWSPINFCPPENKTLPCPPPVGAVIPWERRPEELSLPAPRVDGAVAQDRDEDPLHRRPRRDGGGRYDVRGDGLRHRQLRPLGRRAGYCPARRRRCRLLGGPIYVVGGTRA